MSQSFFSSREDRLVNAIEANDEAAVRQAIASGIPVNALGRAGMTPLILAIIKPRTAAVRGLLAKGANPNLRRENGDTAVTLAAQSGGNDLTVLKLLLDAGGHSNAWMRSDDPILMVYIGSYTLEAIRRLAKHGANLDALSRTETPLIVNAALAQSWDVVWTMIEPGATYRAARPFPGGSA